MSQILTFKKFLRKTGNNIAITFTKDETELHQLRKNQPVEIIIKKIEISKNEKNQ